MGSPPPDGPTPRLPDLDPGINVLDVDTTSLSPLYSLVLDHLLTGDERGPAVWIDPGRTARATTLARMAPTPRLLDRIDVARGVTPHQHHALIGAATRRVSPQTPLVVAPRIDARYRGDDCSRGTADRALSTIARRLDRIATTRHCPVLVTRREADDLTVPLDRVATRTVSVVDTRFGPQFRGEDFETTVYPVSGAGDVVQTTLAFWAEVLEHRATAVETDRVAATTAPEVTAGGPE